MSADLSLHEVCGQAARSSRAAPDMPIAQRIKECPRNAAWMLAAYLRFIRLHGLCLESGAMLLRDARFRKRNLDLSTAQT